MKTYLALAVTLALSPSLAGASDDISTSVEPGTPKALDDARQDPSVNPERIGTAANPDRVTVDSNTSSNSPPQQVTPRTAQAGKPEQPKAPEQMKQDGASPGAPSTSGAPGGVSWESAVKAPNDNTATPNTEQSG